MHANKTRVLDLFQALDKNADVNMASDSGRRTGVEHGYALLGLDSLVAAAPTDASSCSMNMSKLNARLCLAFSTAVSTAVTLPVCTPTEEAMLDLRDDSGRSRWQELEALGPQCLSKLGAELAKEPLANELYAGEPDALGMAFIREKWVALCQRADVCA